MRQWTLPYVRLAIEAGLTEWLTFRGGAQKFVWDRTQKTLVDDRRDNANDRRTTRQLDPVPTTGTPTFQSFAGVGIYWHGLAFDLMLDPMFFFRGPSFISGSAGALFQRVSLAYQF
jgi:hypothetical protein